MSIVLVGSTSGSITLQEPAVAGTTVLDLPAVSGTILTTGSSGQSIPKAALPTGSVLQVVQGKLSTSFSTSSTSAVDTGLTASITPTSATSKVLCYVTLNGIRTNNTTNNLYAYLVRNGTNLDNVGVSGSFFTQFTGTSGQTNGRVGTVTNMILDTPATTSACTYKVQFACESGSQTSFLNDQNTMLTVSTIILMEIAA
jgi:hypothetical protein